jgi:hypothetical protein
MLKNPEAIFWFNSKPGDYFLRSYTKEEFEKRRDSNDWDNTLYDKYIGPPLAFDEETCKGVDSESIIDEAEMLIKEAVRVMDQNCDLNNRDRDPWSCAQRYFALDFFFDKQRTGEEEQKSIRG